MLEELKKQVYYANMKLASLGLVVLTWGNVSGIDREKNIMVIKPSGLEYEKMSPLDMVAIDISTGKIVDGDKKPSTDANTHIALYKRYKEMGGITHTHSTYAVAFAQAGIPIPVLGTTHADYWEGDILCTRSLTEEEVETSYETNTGKVIIETLETNSYNPVEMPGIIVKNHGPFAWGKTAMCSVQNALILETVADMSYKTLMLNPNASIENFLLKKHYNRKHGKNAYYGQLENVD